MRVTGKKLYTATRNGGNALREKHTRTACTQIAAQLFALGHTPMLIYDAPLDVPPVEASGVRPRQATPYIDPEIIAARNQQFTQRLYDFIHTERTPTLERQQSLFRYWAKQLASVVIGADAARLESFFIAARAAENLEAFESLLQSDFKDAQQWFYHPARDNSRNVRHPQVESTVDLACPGKAPELLLLMRHKILYTSQDEKALLVGPEAGTSANKRQQKREYESLSDVEHFRRNKLVGLLLFYAAATTRYYEKLNVQNQTGPNLVPDRDALWEHLVEAMTRAVQDQYDDRSNAPLAIVNSVYYTTTETGQRVFLLSKAWRDCVTCEHYFRRIQHSREDIVVDPRTGLAYAHNDINMERPFVTPLEDTKQVAQYVRLGMQWLRDIAQISGVIYDVTAFGVSQLGDGYEYLKTFFIATQPQLQFATQPSDAVPIKRQRDFDDTDNQSDKQQRTDQDYALEAFTILFLSSLID